MTTKRYFVISSDLSEYFVYRRGLSLEMQQVSALDKIESDFVRFLRAALATMQINTMVLCASHMRKALLPLGRTVPTVCLEPMYAPTARYSLAVCSDRGIALKSRPGAASLEEQIRRIVDTDVCLIDSGAKSGWTIERAVTLLSQNGVRTRSVLLGVANRPAIARIEKLAPVSAIYTTDMLEWLETHDLVVDADVGAGEMVARFRFPRSTTREIQRQLITLNKKVGHVITTTSYGAGRTAPV